jgi:hypothetical protein
VKQKIQTKRLAISNEENDSDKKMKIAASEQARKRIVGNVKHDAQDSTGWWRENPVQIILDFDALSALSDSSRAEQA